MNLCTVLSRLINKHTHRVANNMQKNFELAVCFVGKFLLFSGMLDFVDARAISVVNQIKDGDNPVPLILAKTLLGLDFVFHDGESQNIRRSPFALQTRLVERLDIIATPIVANYGPGNFLSRTILKTECQIESDWVKLLNKKSSASIR